MKRIMFLTGTRADYGKIKSLMVKVLNHNDFELQIFVTGMHMLSKYGSTWKEIEKDGFNDTYKYINQSLNSSMDLALSNTITGLSHYISENKPDMIVVHGDRIEALAGAMSGALNNILVAHIEGGEVSGTIDESIRHAITKFSHLHLVSTNEAEKRIMQLGEPKESIFVIGSPDIDIMLSDQLPTLQDVKWKYDFAYDEYAVIMYHPVTTEVDKLQQNVKNLVDAVIESDKNYIVVYPNNDEGSSIILDEYKRLEGNKRFKIYPSMKFEFFLTLLKNAEFLIGNSSAGIREAGVYGVPSIDIGNRQHGRYSESVKSIQHVEGETSDILAAIVLTSSLSFYSQEFGKGNSDESFIKILERIDIWERTIQKSFIDMKQEESTQYV